MSFIHARLFPRKILGELSLKKNVCLIINKDIAKHCTENIRHFVSPITCSLEPYISHQTVIVSFTQQLCVNKQIAIHWMLFTSFLERLHRKNGQNVSSRKLIGSGVCVQLNLQDYFIPFVNFYMYLLHQ